MAGRLLRPDEVAGEHLPFPHAVGIAQIELDDLLGAAAAPRGGCSEQSMRGVIMASNLNGSPSSSSTNALHVPDLVPVDAHRDGLDRRAAGRARAGA